MKQIFTILVVAALTACGGKEESMYSRQLLP